MLKPTILTEGNYSHQDISEIKQQPHWRVKDLLPLQLAELYEIDNPDQVLKPDFSQKQQTYINDRLTHNGDLVGDWIYYPWNGIVLHSVNQLDYERLRTNRNQLLITPAEQQKLLEACVGVVGLSIGSHFVRTMAYNGIAHTFKLAEFDTLSTSNLNRVQARLADVGEKKSDIICQQIFDINPYQQFEIFEQGLDTGGLPQFLGGNHKPAVVFEAVDDFEMKIRLRLAAKQQGIPVIMLTNLGDTMLIDIERYDLDAGLPIFNGAIGDVAEKILSTPLTEQDKVRYAVNMVSVEHMPTRAIETLLQINKTLVGRPQLVSTVTMGGGVAAMLARRIILQQELPSGRYHTAFTSWFNLVEEEQKTSREAIIQALQSGFNV